jgi:hypothetical protein
MVMGVRCHHEGPRLHRQQVVLAHNPRCALVIHQHPAPAQFRRDSSITDAPPVLDRPGKAAVD